MTEWVKDSDQVPLDGQEVIAWNEKHGFYVCIAEKITEDCSFESMKGKTYVNMKSSGCGCCDGCLLSPYFWMPLPEPPK